MAYQFPVTNKFQANEVTQPDFSIEPDYMDELYADINPYRYDGNEFWDQLKFKIGIEKDELTNPTGNFQRIIFSGHRGCGKSLELFRFNEYLNDTHRYYSLLIDMEQELIFSRFEPEDLFMLITVKLAERIYEDKLPVGTTALDEIAKEWFAEKEVVDEVNKAFKGEVSAEVSAGASLWTLVKMKAGLKTLLSYDSKTSTHIRRKVKDDPFKLIDRLNIVFSDLRQILEANGKGKDLLFIIDGSEKLDYTKYEELFINRLNQLSALQVNTIYTVPIKSFYTLENSVAQSMYFYGILPMVNLSLKDSSRHFRQIISKRLDDATFFDNGVLDYLVTQSGGCPRQLVLLVNRAIVQGLGNKISMNIAEKAVHEEGRRLRDRLSNQQIEKIKEAVATNNFDVADKDILTMLLELVLLKYNGEKSLNPILQEFIH